MRAAARFGASNREIADMFGCDEGTIRHERYAVLLAKARAERRMKLRQMQWKSAEAGSVAMQIFLGKNELGQSDNGPEGDEEESTVVRVRRESDARAETTTPTRRRGRLIRRNG